jgi:hypothetical protein
LKDNILPGFVMTAAMDIDMEQFRALLDKLESKLGE